MMISPSPASHFSIDELRDCENEPIHIPSAIQPHGVLLTLRDDATIAQASENCTLLFDAPAELLSGTALEQLLEPATASRLVEQIKALALSHQPTYLPGVPMRGRTETWDAVVHRTDQSIVLEFMPGHREAFAGQYQIVRNAIARLRSAHTLEDLCQAAVEEVRRITGFDRVMVYRFDPAWNGEVIAEDRMEALPSWRGLNYPASDIPPQARELYRRNWLRLIADVNYTPSPLAPLRDPRSSRPLDMSHSMLRSVSPVHLQYLKNMDVGASMSVSILKGDRLWGLIACHHRTPRYVSYELCTACELLGQMFSTAILSVEDAANREERQKVRATQSRLADHMAQDHDICRALIEHHPNLLAFLNADGAAVWRDGRCQVLGQSPEPRDVERIVQWLSGGVDLPVFQTDSLPKLFPEADAFKDVACGVIAARISRNPDFYLMWFRPEVIQTVHWAGDPSKPYDVDGQPGDPPRLCPRRSFEMWKETVSLTARPWLTAELEAVGELRVAVLSAELANLNSELNRSNHELDSFAHVASHDLKEPLRGMQAYVHYLVEDYAQRLEAEGVRKLHVLKQLSQRMSTLIDSLLYYSRVGRSELSREPTDLNILLQETIDTLRMTPEWVDVEVRVPERLPTITCDPVRVGEVFQNLLTNSVKYNDHEPKAVEIGVSDDPRIVAAAAFQGPVFYVRDNGIGIAEKHFQKIFDFFKRLHGRDKYGGGTGAGLAIVKTIVERHGGRIWVESTPGAGTTFYFTLRPEDDA